MFLPTTRRFACGLIATGALAGTAIAATPESGSVSKASPSVKWAGQTTGSYFTRVPTAVTADDTVPCIAPSCDSFALNVADSANLTVAADITQSADNAGAVTIRIRKPDGSVIVTSSDAGAVSEGKPLKVQIKSAPVGDYTVEYWNNFFDGPIDYTGSAELAVPPPAAAAPAPAPSPAPAPGGGSGGSSGGSSGGGDAPAPVEAIGLKVTGAKAKNKKASAKVTVSRPVAAVQAVLRKGKKTLGKGKRGATSGTATIAVKTKKKLKKGTYALTVTVTDGKTSTAKTVKVKVR